MSILALSLSLSSSLLLAELPAPVAEWQAQHPGAAVHGWRQHPLPFSGTTVWRIKNSSHYAVVGPSGQEVDGAEALRVERQNRWASRGTFTDRLHELVQAKPNDTFLVSISPANSHPAPVERPQTDTEFEAIAVANHAFVKGVLVPIADKVMQLGGEVVVQGNAAPFLFARLNAAQLEELRYVPEIDTIEAESDQVAQYGRLWSSNGASHLLDLQTQRGLSGNGQALVLVEMGRLREDPQLPGLAWNLLIMGGVSRGTSLNRDPICGDTDFHAAAVAGILSARDTTAPFLPSWISGAFGARVFVANTCTSADSLLARFLAADEVSFLGLGPGAWSRIFNHSYGEEAAHEKWGGGAWQRAVDYRAKYLMQTEVLACGQRALAFSLSNGYLEPRGMLPDPVACRAFNAISVGGFNDKETTAWSDDEFYISDQHNPVLRPTPRWTTEGYFVNRFGFGSDRELPETAASAVFLATPDQDSSFRESLEERTGTSFAAPRVASLVALLHELDPSLRFQPEVTKAIVLAGAVHRVQGASLPAFGAGKIGGAYTADLRVGVGGISGKAAAQIVDRSSGTFEWFQSSFQLWNPSGAWQTFAVEPQITPSKPRVRIVLSWLAESNCAHCIVDSGWPGERYLLPTDLDFEVLDANGNFVASSLSFDNNYEIVDFEVGQHALPLRIRIKAFEVGPVANEVFGLASYWYDPASESP